MNKQKIAFSHLLQASIFSSPTYLSQHIPSLGFIKRYLAGIEESDRS